MAKFLEKMRDPKDFVWQEEGLNLYDGFQYLIDNISEPFHLSWAHKQLVQHCRIYNEKPAEHIRQLLNQSNALGKISQPDPIYYPACLLFNNTQFALYPTQTEIDQGKLVLGDALRPYHAQGILFQELSFFGVKNLRFETTAIPCSYKNLDTWFLHIKDLDEPILNGLLYDESLPLSEEQRWKGELEYQVPALEVSGLFHAFNFKKGDAVVFTVRSYQKGEFELRILKSSPKRAIARSSQDYQNLIEEKVIEKINQTGLSPFLYRALNDAYADMRHYGFFRNLMPLAWTRFLKKSKRLKVFSYNHDQFLYKGRLDRLSQVEIAQEFYCNFKRSENLNDLLEFYNSVLNEELVKAYAFQALRESPLKKGDFFEQLFVRFPLDPFSEYDLGLFSHFSEAFWQEVETSFPLVVENKAQLDILNDALALFEKILQSFYASSDFVGGYTLDHVKDLQNLRLGVELIVKKLNMAGLSLFEVDSVKKLLHVLSKQLSEMKNRL